jgi:hypothetical protein
MKKIIFGLSIFCFTLISISAFAQENREIKVKIVEETIDENGNVQKSEKVLTGEDAKLYLENHKSDGEEMEIEVEVNDQSKEKKRIIIRTDGNEEIIDLEGEKGINHWNSDDNVKVRIIKKGDGNNISIDETEDIIILNDDAHENSYKLIFKEDGGENKIIEWEGEGDMPSEIKELMKNGGKFEKGKKELIFKNGDHDVLWVPGPDSELDELKKEHFFSLEDNSNMNKAFLGVTIENGSRGIKINGFTENSAAKEAGLMEGDEIFKVGKQKVKTMEELIASLKAYNPGDEVKIKYFRNGKKSKVKAQLKERPAQRFEFKNFEMDGHDFEFHPNHENGKLIIIDIEGDENEYKVKELEKSIKKTITIEIEEMENEMETLEEEMTILKKELEEMEIEESSHELLLNDFKAFPNPADDEINIHFETKEQGDLMIEMVDVSGKWVNKELRKNFTGKFDQTFNLSNAPQGNIIISIMQNGKQFSHTVMVK